MKTNLALITVLVLTAWMLLVCTCVSGVQTAKQKTADTEQHKATLFEGTWIGLDEREGYYSTLIFNGNTITMINQRKDGTGERSTVQRTFSFNGKYPDTSIIGRSIEPYTITIYGGEPSTMYYHINGNELKLSIPINAENYYRLKSIMDCEDAEDRAFKSIEEKITAEYAAALVSLLSR